MESVIFMGLGFVILSLMLFTGRKNLKKGDYIAAIFLLLMGLQLAVKVRSFEYGFLEIPWIVTSNIPFLYGPMLLFYTEAVIRDDFKLTWKKSLHFLPFILVFPFIILMSPEGPRPFPPDLTHEMVLPPLPPDLMGPLTPPDLPPHGFDHYITPGVFIIISFVFYTGLILVVLKKHRRKISEYFSYDTIEVNLGWLRWIVVCFVVSYCFVIFSISFAPGMYRTPILHPGFAPETAITFFIFAFSYFSLRQPVIFKNKAELARSIEPEKENKEAKEKKEKYEKSGLRDTESEKYAMLLEKYMKSEKPYMDPDLTISDLSTVLKIPRHHLAQTINEKLKKNFYNYINDYRVNEAKNILSDIDSRDKTVLRIAYECGFNSKSSFNSVFKKMTGITPTEYREQVR